MQCTLCHHVNPADANFCNQCGQSLLPRDSSAANSTPQGTRAAALAPREPHRPDAERRHLTVMFCDLVDSTPLSAQLDPEDYHNVIRSYQVASAEVIESFGGFVAQHLGDGLLVYFGFPQAHEDDAQRAIRAGLGILETIGPLNTCLEQDYGIRLRVRIGIHTGRVVIGEIGSSLRQEHLAVGETPNIAARLQSMASPNTIIVSASTHHLIQGYFICEDMGFKPLKGISAPMQVYGVRGAIETESRFAAMNRNRLTPFVGRDEEIGLVLSRWERARQGQGQVILLSGEPGIGKSRLTQALRERIAVQRHIEVRYQCLPYYTNTAFYPFTTQLEKAAQFASDDTPSQKLDKLEALFETPTQTVAEAAPLVAAILSLPTQDRYPQLALSPQMQKSKTIEALVEQFASLTHRQPVLMIFEDAHWCDPTSLEVLGQLIQRAAETRTLVVITCRPGFVPPWPNAPHVASLPLNRLETFQIASLIEQLTGGKSLPEEVFGLIRSKADGIPLFVEELMKNVLESEQLTERGNAYVLSGSVAPLAIPETLEDLLMARLDRLSSVKELAQIGAVIGREFSYALIAAIAPLRDEAVQDGLRLLVNDGLIFQRGAALEATYLFKHALVQDAAYMSMVTSRRQELHATIAHVLETGHVESGDAPPELIAHHYTAAGYHAQGARYWHQAGLQASERSAHIEAIGHLTQELALLKTLPDTPQRLQQEIDAQITLGPAVIATKGYGSPDSETAYLRAQELCQRAPEGQGRSQLFFALHGLWNCALLRAEMQKARDIAERLLTLAEQRQDSHLLVEVHRVLGSTLFMQGEPTAARSQLEQGIARYNRRQHHALSIRFGADSGVVSRSYAGFTLWLLGFADQALRRSEEALALAEELSHPFSLAFAQQFHAVVHQHRREAAAAQARAAAAIALSRKQGFPHWLAQSDIVQSWALAEQGQGDEELARIQHNVAAYKSTGAQLGRPYFIALAAHAYWKAGQTGGALHLLAEALDMVAKTKER